MIPTSVFAEEVEGNVQYIDQDGVTRECNVYYSISDPDGYISNGTEFAKGWYVVDESWTLKERVTVTGDIYIILVNGKTLTAEKGISVNGVGNLHIYGQEGNSGKLIANESNQTFVNL